MLHFSCHAEAGQHLFQTLKSYVTVDRLWRLIVLLFFLLCSLSPRSVLAQELSRHSFRHYQMGTQFRLVFYAESEETAKNLAIRAFEELDLLNLSLSDYLPDSELNLLCQKAGIRRKSPVSQDLWQVLLLSQSVSRKSKGAFDVSVGALSKLWRTAFKKRAFPDPLAIEQVLPSVNYKRIKVARGTPKVALYEAGVQLDLGGIAKGYAADKIAEILREAGYRHYLVDAGGDLLLGEAPPGREGWRIATANQSGKSTEFLTNCAIATSGDTYQYLEWQGKRYSHIIDPRTGYGLTDQLQVTVIARTGALADALASTLSVLNEKSGKKLLKKFPGSSATFLKAVPNK